MTNRTHDRSPLCSFALDISRLLPFVNQQTTYPLTIIFKNASLRTPGNFHPGTVASRQTL